jgi:hypothetical protein
MAARRRSSPDASSAQLRVLGPLGFLVSTFHPAAREFLRSAVVVTAAASLGGRSKDQDLVYRAIEKAFEGIEATCPNDEQAEPDAWLRRQLEGLEGGRDGA